MDDLKAGVGKQTEIPVAFRMPAVLEQRLLEGNLQEQNADLIVVCPTACTGAGWALIQSLQPELFSLLLLFKNNN